MVRNKHAIFKLARFLHAFTRVPTSNRSETGALCSICKSLAVDQQARVPVLECCVINRIKV
jgi:hypothetical protein